MRAEKQLKTLAITEVSREPLKSFTIAGVKQIRGDHGKVLAYVAELRPEGFIITAADTDITPLLGYSFKGKFPFEDLKQNVLLHLVQWDVEARMKAMSLESSEVKTVAQDNESLWLEYTFEDGALLETLSSATQWGPLITTNWDQNYHYNGVCPKDPRHGTQRCVVGCVAVAAAQIINYWKYPTSVSMSAEDAYTSWDLFKERKPDPLMIDIDDDSEQYDFPSFDTDRPGMPSLNTKLKTIQYNGDHDEEAYLCFAVGIKHRMNYSWDVSGSLASAFAYLNGFNYGSAQLVVLPVLSVYKNGIIENIKKGWPVQIGITKHLILKGHSAIVDGYKDTGEFHLNMGWHGRGDSWYFLPIVDASEAPLPEDYYANTVFSIVYDIYPYQGWNQYSADEKNSFSTTYAAPTADPPLHKWQRTCLSGHQFGGLVVGTGNNIYAACSKMWWGSGDPLIYVINKYGELINSIVIGSEDSGDQEIECICQSPKGDIFVSTGGEDAFIYRVDTTTDTSTKIFTDPGGHDIYVLKVDSEGYLYACTAYNIFRLNRYGTVLWSFPAPINTEFHAEGKNIAVDTDRDRVYGVYHNTSTKVPCLVQINRLTGGTVASRTFASIPVNVIRMPIVGVDGTVYMGIYDTHYALYHTNINGTPKWSHSINLEKRAISQDGGTIFAPFWNGTLKFGAFNSTDLSLKWSFTLPDFDSGTDSIWQPYVAGNNVVCFTVERAGSSPTYTIYAYRDNGSSYEYLWEYDASTSVGAFAFGPGGTLYFYGMAGEADTIYAVSEGPVGDPDGGGMAFTNNTGPNTPFNPIPIDEATDVGPSVTLSWTCSDPEEHSLKYSLFVGESGYDMVPVDANVTGTSYMLSGLKAGTGYAWKIIATDGQAPSESPTWVFSTRPPNPDINGDWRVNFKDLARLASHWREGNWAGPENLDWVGNVDFEDMRIIAENWLQEQAIPSDMTLIPPGSFQMGDSKNEGYSRERPVHTVTLDSFCIGKYEVTNSQYCQYLNCALGSTIYVSGGEVYGSGNNQLYCDTSTADSDSQIAYTGGVFTVRTKGVRNMAYDPMGQVSWYGAVAYCNWRSQQDGYEQCYNLSTWVCDSNKKGYRLATEAEWEYAARGGLVGNRFPWGDTISQTQANFYSSTAYLYDESSVKNQYHPLWIDITYPYTSPVGFFDGTVKYKADYQWPGSATSYQTSIGKNNFDLYDMAGNVWEWCNDWYSGTYYSSSPPNNPTGPTSASSRVLRGGDWYSDIGCWGCRVACRNYGTPVSRNCNWGFRVVLDLN